MPRALGTALVAVLALAAASAAPARPFTVADLLSEQSIGKVLLDPTGRAAVLEIRDRYDSGTRFDYDGYNDAALTRLFVTDLKGGPATPLLSAKAGRGHSAAAFSPDGRRLAVYRFRAGTRTLWVVDLRTRRARGFGITPDWGLFGRNLQWLSDHELLVIARTDGRPPWPVGWGHVSADRLPTHWRDTARGRGSVTVWGSGAFADLTPRSAPRRLLRIDVRRGTIESLATGPFLDLEISPDRRRVALREEGEPIRYPPGQPLQGVWGMATHRQRLAVLDLRTRDLSHPCPACDLLPYVFSWSPSGRAFLAFAREGATPWTEGRFRQIAIPDMSVAEVGLDLAPVLELRPEIIRAGWMGEQPIAYARRGGDRADWFALTAGTSRNLTADLPPPPADLLAAGPEGLALIAGGRLLRIAADGRSTDAGPARGLRAGRQVVEGRLYFAPPRQSWIETGPAESPRIEAVDAAGVRPFGAPPSDGAVLAVSPASGALLLERRAPSGMTQLATWRDGRGSPLVEINRGLADVDAPRILPIHHLGPEGQPLTSWLYAPAHPGARPPPLLVHAYWGDTYAAPPPDFAPPSRLMDNLRVLVGHGYAVLLPSLPKARAAHGEPMAGIAERILGVVDAAHRDPATAPLFDPDRLGIWGYSYGGYTVMAALTQTDRFRAGVAIAGISNLIDQWSSNTGAKSLTPEEEVWMALSAGNVEAGQGEMGRPPYEDPLRYLRNSPLFAAGRVTTPILMARGDQDQLSLAQGEAMFEALQRQDKDAVLLTYWGETHQITSPGNVRDFYRRAFEFLDQALSFEAISLPASRSRLQSPRPLPRRRANRRRPRQRVLEFSRM